MEAQMNRITSVVFAGIAALVFISIIQSSAHISRPRGMAQDGAASYEYRSSTRSIASVVAAIQAKTVTTDMVASR